MTIGDRAPDHDDSDDNTPDTEQGVFSHKIFDEPAKLPRDVDWEGNGEAKV